MVVQTSMIFVPILWLLFCLMFLWLCPSLWIVVCLLKSSLLQNMNKEIVTAWVFLRIDKTFTGFGITVINSYVHTWCYHTTDKTEQELINQYFPQLIHRVFTSLDLIQIDLCILFINSTRQVLSKQRKARNTKDGSVSAYLA